MNSVANLTERFPALCNIPNDALPVILKGAQEVRLPPNQRVFNEGDSCSQYLIVLEGSVRVQRVTEEGREILLYRVEAGQSCILTTSCLLGAEAYPAEGVTETEVSALALPANNFNRALAESTAFRQFVFSVYTTRITELILLVEEVAFGRLDRRLAQCLLQHHRTTKGSIRLTHQELAIEMGTAREVVSRVLKEFERRQCIALGRGRIDVTDTERLGDIHQLGLR